MKNQELAVITSRAASAALLKIGKIYQEEGMLHQALSPYLKILAYYPESENATAAVDHVIAIATTFAEKRQFYVTMSVYDRLEGAVRFQRWDGHQVTPDSNIL